MQPIYDYYATIVYSANSSNVELVVVDGKIVVKDKKLVSASFSEVRKDLLSLTEKIKKTSKEL